MDASPPADETRPATPDEEEEDKKKKKKKKGNGYVLFPIRHAKLWDLYKTIEGGFWTAEDPTFLAISTGRELDLPATRLVASLVAAVRGANHAEKLSSAIRDGEASCFLGFQAMQENVHLEAVTYLASIDPANELDDIAIPRLDWPAARTSDGPPGSVLLCALESAATYAAASALMGQVILDLPENSALGDIAGRIEHDYDLSYKFALATCPAFGEATRGHLEAVLEIGRAVAELVNFECNRVFPTYPVDISTHFVYELEHEITSYIPPPETANAAENKFATDSSF